MYGPKLKAGDPNVIGNLKFGMQGIKTNNIRYRRDKCTIIVQEKKVLARIICLVSSHSFGVSFS